MDNIDVENLLSIYDEKKFELEHFCKAVKSFFTMHPKLNQASEDNLPIVHSVKSRVKSRDHLSEKIHRKSQEARVITESNFLNVFTDLAGVRVLHLYQSQFVNIHSAILKQVSDGAWYFLENPKAYTWDPESRIHFEQLDITTHIKDSFYTSIHYLVKPNKNSDSVCCEIQVRTLFEEIWGEIDHSINYPRPIDSIACKEQLKVLARLISTGTKLSDSIFKSYDEHIKNKNIK